ncbi:hypothetical protein WG66_016724, partial [Moniliophthora roreri]
MSSGEPTVSRSSSQRASIAGRSGSQIPLPPSEAGSIRENEVRDTVISLNAGSEADLDLQSMNTQESIPSSTRMWEEFWKVEEAKRFLRKVAEHDPYIPNPRPIPTMPTENVDEEKKPTRTESWERMLKEVSRHDEDMVKGWRDDIDTLLVFAGLFSAVVTAFVIESYQWLDEDPADTTVTLLAHLISVQVNGSQSASFEPTQFKPDASSIRINVFWFLSLILSLTSALFGLLCKQWVREHQRDTTTRTPGEALALRQLRRDSFEKWGVSSFLEKVTRNDVDDNTILGGRIADSPDEMIEIASRESGEGHDGNAQHLRKDDNTKESGSRQRTGTGILGDSSGQGCEVGGDSYGLHRQGSRVDAMGQPTHDQEDMDEDNAQRLRIHTGTLGDLIEQDNEVGVHGDSYRFHRLCYYTHPKPISQVEQCLGHTKWENQIRTSRNECVRSLRKERRIHVFGISQRAGCQSLSPPCIKYGSPLSNHFVYQIIAMSSGDLAVSRSSSPRTSIARTSGSQIPLPPSEAGSIRENESMNIPEAASPSSESTEDDEFNKLLQRHFFLQDVAKNDPYIPNPRPMPTKPTENVDEEKKPTRTESWERVLKEVSRHDEDMVKGWRDDIDTLLVFAGLFSAIVTAFVIESYQWLDEDPADTTVTLLTHLILVQVNGSQATPFEPTQFKADASSIRINVFWFLSLILSLTSALFGLLCKQWIREHQRDTTTRTPGEALALRQLRRDSFEKWGVLSFLSALPILLEVALLFFFVGVLDLLWNRHRVPFAVCFVAISFSTGLYFLTTLLPTLMVPRDQTDDIEHVRFNQLSYQFICPYKSPQA